MYSKYVSGLRHSIKYIWPAGGSILAVAYMYPHTLGLEDYKESITAHRYGKPEMLNLEIRAVCEEIYNGFKWTHSSRFHSKRNIELVVSHAMEFSHKGSTATKWGGLVGIPRSYVVESDKNDLVSFLKQHNIDASSEAASKIENTFNLSSDAKKFALAREMWVVDSCQIYFNAIGMALGTSFLYVIPSVISELLPGPKSVFFLITVPLLVLGCLAVVKKMSRYLDHSTDKAVAGLSPEVGQGGLEFYSAVKTRQDILQEEGQPPTGNAGFSPMLQTFLKRWADIGLSASERRDKLETFLLKNEAERELPSSF